MNYQMLQIHHTMQKTLFLIVLAMLALSSCQEKVEFKKETTMFLSDNWQFRQVGNENWMPASIPGCVHTDLMENEVIEDPFYRLNEHDVQWVDKEDWEYSISFPLNEKMLSKENIQIVFE